MKIQSIKIENFLAIEEAEFSLEDLGLVYIAGENHDETSADSNGSGKSSIGDAISWSLWGSTARGVTGDDVINTAAGKGTRVVITIDDDGQMWRILRHRKYPKRQNSLKLERHDGNEWADMTKGTTKLTQKAIERLMGCSEEVFNSAVYSGQEQMPDLPNMTDIALKKLVEQAAGVDVLTTAYEIARQRLREASQSTAEAQIDYDRAVTRRDDAKASLARLQQQQSAWEGEQKDKVKRLKAEATAAIAEATKAKKDLDPDGKQEVLDKIEQTEAKIASVSDEREREQLLAEDARKAEQVYTRATGSEKISDDVTKTARSDFEEAKKGLEAVKTGKVANCPSCSRPYDESHKKNAIEKAQAKVDAAKQKVIDCVQEQASDRKKLGVAEKMRDKADESLKQHREGMTDVSSESEKIKHLNRELQVIEATEREVERLIQAARGLGDKFKEARSATNPYKQLVDDGEKGLEDLGDDVDMASAKLKERKGEESYAQAVSDVFAPNGVRAYRLDEATPFLNERTSHYLGSLADGQIEAFWTTISESRSGKLVDKFSITVEKQGSAPTFKALSGGEKRKVRLACALALQDLVSARADKSIDLWIGDEIDDALDDAGLERLMGVLDQKARERGTVLCISHNDIASYARRTMLVRKENDKAKVILS